MQWSCLKINKNINLINEFLNHKENVQRCSDHTIRAYKNDLIQYMNFISEYSNALIDAESKHIQYYLNNIGKSEISGKTMARKLASIKSFYNYLANNKIINTNIARTIKTPKISKRLPNFLTIKEIKKLLNYPYGDSLKNSRDQLILELFYSTGIRISELVQIKIKDIDFLNRLIKIKGKGNKERFVIFGDCMNSILTEYMNKSRMFPSSVCVVDISYLRYPTHQTVKVLYKKFNSIDVLSASKVMSPAETW